MLFWRHSGKPHSTISTILTSGLAVYLSAIESGDFILRSLVAESGLQCPKCGTADCTRYHGRWFRTKILDLCIGEAFENLPILRVKFCQGPTKSLFPAELWRGRSTVSSVLEVVSNAIDGGVEQALQWAMAAGDGDEPVSERSIRRWVKRSGDRVPVASATLNFPADGGQPAAEKFENFLTRLHPGHLLELRQRWGYSLLDVPGPQKPPRSTTCPKPVFPDPLPPHEVPSEYLPRGTRLRRSRRGRSPDD